MNIVPRLLIAGLVGAAAMSAGAGLVHAAPLAGLSSAAASLEDLARPAEGLAPDRVHYRGRGHYRGHRGYYGRRYYGRGYYGPRYYGRGYGYAYRPYRYYAPRYYYPNYYYNPYYYRGW